jgi:nucleoside-diphosphate-sugar epimerase
VIPQIRPFNFGVEKPYPEADFRKILAYGKDDFLKFKNKKILVIGASGFVGRWISESFIRADQEFNLNLRITLTSKTICKRFKSWGISHEKVHLIEIDLRDSIELLQKKTEIADYIFFCANYAENSRYHENSLRILENVLSHLSKIDSCPTFINLSSGAVYGQNSRKFPTIPESNRLPRIPSEPYGKLKWQSERMVESATLEGQILGSNPRLFTFYGPGLSVGGNFAVGEFIFQAFLQKEIVIRGNPDSLRSYMHPVDLILALIRLSLNPTLNTVHIGSAQPITIGKLAMTIHEIFQLETPINIPLQLPPPNYYFPETELSRRYLKSPERVSFDIGLREWIKWLAKVEI